MKVLVTGGLGFIGSHTIVELLNNNIEVICVDNLTNSITEIKNRISQITNKNFIFYNIDVTDYIALEKVFVEHNNIDSIIHFAAFKSVSESVIKSLDYYQNNIVGLINILKLAEQNNAKIVFSSSCTVYGEPKELPINEDSELVKPSSPYGNTKKICEEILQDFTINSEIKVVSLRYFNPVGAHESGLIGELPIGVPQNLFPFVTQTAIGIRDVLTIYGNDYDTPDGTCIRDYIHVVDLANAHLKAIEYFDKMNQNYDVFNVGTGNGISVLEIVNKFEKLTNLELNYKFGNRRDGDIVKIWADNSKALNLLNWKPKFGINEMILTSWNWQKKYSV